MLNYILPVLIFLSLGVIVFIIGKHLPDLKKAQVDNDLDKKNLVFKQKILSIFLEFFKKIKKALIFLAEKIVKKIKKILHLVHFWLIKIKKNKGKEDEFYNDIEAKEQLIREEEDELDCVINGDLATADEQDLIKKEQSKKQEYDLKELKKEKKQEEKNPVDDYYLKDENIKKTEETDKKNVNKKNARVDKDFKEEILGELAKEENVKQEKEKQKSHQKVKEFFLEDQQGTTEIDKEIAPKLKEEYDDNQVELEKGGFSDQEESLKKNKLKKKKILGFVSNIFKRKNDDEIEKNDYVEDDSENDQFSDGIVKIEDYKRPEEKENLLIKEVVKVDRNDADIDDELGVDRKILEKKLIQKIVKSPKQIENYRQLGELYVKVENYIEAVECYKQILKIYPRDVDSKRKLEKISFLKRVKKEK